MIGRVPTNKLQLSCTLCISSAAAVCSIEFAPSLLDMCRIWRWCDLVANLSKSASEASFGIHPLGLNSLRVTPSPALVLVIAPTDTVTGIQHKFRCHSLWHLLCQWCCVNLLAWFTRTVHDTAMEPRGRWPDWPDLVLCLCRMAR